MYKATVKAYRIAVFRQAGEDGRVRGVRNRGDVVEGTKLVINEAEKMEYLKFGYRRFLPIRSTAPGGRTYASLIKI